MRQAFLIVKKSINGKKIYYVKMWNKTTRRYAWKSIQVIKEELGSRGIDIPHTSKAGAQKLVQIWLSSQSINHSTDRLDNYLLTFWKEDSNFIKGQALRGKKYSSDYIRNNHSVVENYFIAFLKKTGRREMLIHQIDAEFLELFINDLSENYNIGTRRINAILQAITVPLSEAYRLGKISENPGKKVKKLQVNTTERRIFSPAEVKKFFQVPQEDPRLFTINLLAATTGLRLGECRGLLSEDIKNGYIEVCHNWQDGEGLKSPKWDSKRRVPIPSRVEEALSELIHTNPYKNDFVFWGSTTEKPIAKRTISINFNKIVEQDLKIVDREDRGLTFHSWRHFFNSMLRGNVHDHILRKLTGHSSEAMTERYTEITEDQIKAVSDLAERIYQ